MTVDVTTLPKTGRRRPSGAPPPLPRSIGTTGLGTIIIAVVLLTWTVLAFNSTGVRRSGDRLDAAILRAVAHLRTPWLTDVMNGISRAGTGWGVSAFGAAFLLSLVVLKRWRHLFTFFGALFGILLI